MLSSNMHLKRATLECTTGNVLQGIKQKGAARGL